MEKSITVEQKKQGFLTKKVVLAWMIVLLISNFSIGLLSFILYQNQILNARAMDAENVATAMALRIDGDKFSEIMTTLEKNDYWYEIKDYADDIADVFGTAYIYILGADYSDKVTYFAEGAIDDAPFDLGTTETIEGIYDDKMFETLKTGKSSKTEPYPSGEYGDMVSGFAAITNETGKVVGVVGVDFFFDDVQKQMLAFALTLSAITVGFLIFCYFFMTYMGTKLAGAPLTALDESAQKLSTGDLDITLDIKSSTEIGRLSDSFAKMIEAIKIQVEALRQLSQGDLTVYVQPRSRKDTMGYALVQILDNLNDIFNELNQSAAMVSAEARQISDSAQTLAIGTNEQTSAINSLSVSISDVMEKADKNLMVAAKTDKLTDAIKSDAQIGSTHMNKMTVAMKDISDASVSIEKVIKVIDDIAFQTNILALNAAVEAARAGQHGKGFAVVAEEVRNLAAKSAQAAKNTEQLISDSMSKTQLGAAIAGETAESLDRIIDGVNECAILVSGITGSFEEQIEAMKQINVSVEQISRVVQQNSATAEESAAASEKMSEQSVILEKLVSRFKLKS